MAVAIVAEAAARLQQRLATTRSDGRFQNVDCANAKSGQKQGPYCIIIIWMSLSNINVLTGLVVAVQVFGTSVGTGKLKTQEGRIFGGHGRLGYEHSGG